MFTLLSLQAGLTAELDTLATEPEGISTKFIDLAFKGGWIMIPILLLSIIAVYIFFDRYFAIKKAGKFDNAFLDKIKVYISNGKIDEALMICKSNPNPASRMLEKGISRIGRPLNDVSAAIENVGNLEISKLEKSLPVLASVAGGAPMLGFLGTVMGMIQAFYDMSNAGNNIDVTLLSTGIYQAMVTTVAGLIVGIIAYFAYNILVTAVEKVVFKMEAYNSKYNFFIFT
jgi:biopolymer transport protein ExbB